MHRSPEIMETRVLDAIAFGLELKEEDKRFLQAMIAPEGYYSRFHKLTEEECDRIEEIYFRVFPPVEEKPRIVHQFSHFSSYSAIYGDRIAVCGASNVTMLCASEQESHNMKINCPKCLQNPERG